MSQAKEPANEAVNRLYKADWNSHEVGEHFAHLYRIVYILRSDVGCPWDREQSFGSLRNDLLEEAYELVEGLVDGDLEAIQEESGDLFLLMCMFSVMADQQQSGTEYEPSRQARFMNSVLASVSEKLLRRHPHVFGDHVVENSDEVVQHWDSIKAKEKQGSRTDRLDGIPRSYPPLMRAYKLQSRASKDGFDWPNADGPRQKVDEELSELDEEITSAASDRTEHRELEQELGDLLFSVVNLARKLGVSPDIALQGANDRFEARFRHMEADAKSSGVSLSDLKLDELDRRWDEAKRQLRGE